jgi:glycosyltransferase involved in cell wall biosynthesis
MAVWDDWNFWNPDTQPLPDNPKSFRKISLVTTCMNRTDTLRQTLEKNIKDNMSYKGEFEIVVVNYGDKSGLDDFIYKDMKEYVDAKIINYVKVEADYYSMTKSRNVGFLAATGEIINQVDADNYTGSFVEVINKFAEIFPEHVAFARSKRLMHGRLGFYAHEFREIGGYDESIENYGGDDQDLLYRFMAYHDDATLAWWSGYGGRNAYSQRIKTPRKEVGTNMKNSNWKETEKINKEITMNNLKKGRLVALNPRWDYGK